MNFRLLLAPSTCLAAALLLSACGSSPKPSAQAIGDVKIEQALVPAWSVKLAGDTALNQSLPMQDGQLAMVSKNGHVHLVRADTGRLVWQLALKTDLNTGAGFDGRNVAVVTRSNELVAVADHVCFGHSATIE